LHSNVIGTLWLYAIKVYRLARIFHRWRDQPFGVYDVSSTPFKKKEQLCLKRTYWQAKEFL
jgi:hypothetical protein